jgi:hypothetical protein
MFMAPILAELGINLVVIRGAWKRLENHKRQRAAKKAHQAELYKEWGWSVVDP